MALTSNLLKKVLGVEGLTFQDLKDETYRKRFSHYLPWVTYDPETKVYGCSDDSVGFIFECSPLAFAGEQTMETLEGLVRLNVPSGSVIQFTLLADPYIEPYLSAYKALKTRDSDLTRASAERFTQFLAEGREGLGKLNNIPVRDFRLVVSAKFPSGGSDVDLNDTRNTIFEILSGANLFPAPMAAEDLIRWMRRLFNGEDYGEEPCRYDDSRPIGEQIIFAETPIVKSMKEMWIGGRCFRCATPKEVPPEVNAVQTNQIFGGVWGIQQDVNQYRTPFPLYAEHHLLGPQSLAPHEVQRHAPAERGRVVRPPARGEKGRAHVGGGRARVRKAVREGHAHPLGLWGKQGRGERVPGQGEEALGGLRLPDAGRPGDTCPSCSSHPCPSGSTTSAGTWTT